MTDKVNLDNYSQEQVNYMVQELCILVNEKDEVKGGETKKFCAQYIKRTTYIIFRSFVGKHFKRYRITQSF
jgi:hypothetical protein